VSAPQSTSSEINNMTLLKQILGKERYGQIQKRLDSQLKEQNKKAEKIRQEKEAKGKLVLDYLSVLYNDRIIQDYIALNGHFSVDNKFNIKFADTGIYFKLDEDTFRIYPRTDERALFKLGHYVNTDIDKYKAEIAKNITNIIESK